MCVIGWSPLSRICFGTLSRTNLLYFIITYATTQNIVTYQENRPKIEIAALSYRRPRLLPKKFSLVAPKDKNCRIMHGKSPTLPTFRGAWRRQSPRILFLGNVDIFPIWARYFPWHFWSLIVSYRDYASLSSKRSIFFPSVHPFNQAFSNSVSLRHQHRRILPRCSVLSPSLRRRDFSFPTARNIPLNSPWPHG